MATCGCTDLTFVGIYKDSFYFDVDEHDVVDKDTFEHSKTSQNLIRCPDSRFLILNEDEQFDLKDLTVSQQRSLDYKLYINIYRDLSWQNEKGRAVILYAVKDGKKFAAVCRDDKVIGAELMEPQRRIEDTKHRAIFYMVLDQAPNKYRLRSSLYPDKALGFDETDLNKLVLCPYEDSNQEAIIEVN